MTSPMTTTDWLSIISALSGAAVLVISAIFSGLAALRTGRVEVATKALVPQIAEIHENTNSKVDAMQQRLDEALSRLDTAHAQRLADTAAARDEAKAHAAELEADVVRRAEEAPAKSLSQKKEC